MGYNYEILRRNADKYTLSVDSFLTNETPASQCHTTFYQNDMEEAVKQLKGTRKTTSRSAEETYNALEKYGTDLVTMAEEGKLDPVIGRWA